MRAGAAKVPEPDASLRGPVADLERKLAECTAQLPRVREAAESERLRYAAFFDSLADPHVLLRPVKNQSGKVTDFVYVEANEAACRCRGCGRAQFIGKKLHELRPGLVVAGLFEMLCRVFDSGEPLSLEDFRCADEGAEVTRWFDIRAAKAGDLLSLTARETTARHESARELSESRRELLLLTENASDVVFKAGPDGTVTYISPSSSVVLGRKPGELTGKPFRNLVHPAEWDAVEALEKQMRKSTGAGMELRLRVGEVYEWFFLSMKPLFGADGVVSGLVAGLRSIRQEVLGREALKAERERLRLTLNALFDPFVLMQPLRDQDGKVTDFLYAEANSAACEWMQLVPEQLLGRRLMELFPAIESLGLMDFYRKTAETSVPLVLDEVPFPMHGTTRWLDVRGVRVDECVSFVWRDMTERHLAAESLAAAEERYRLLAMNSADVVVRLDPEDRIVWISPALKAALGWEPEEVTGRAMPELIGDGGEDLRFRGYKETVSAGGTVAGRIRMWDKDGNRHWVEIHAAAYHTREGRAEGMVASFRVIDDEVKGEQERLQQQEIIANERKHLVDVLEGSDTGTWEWNVQTGATIFNEVWAKLIGYRLDELQPVSIKTWVKFAHPEDLVRSNALLEQCFRREVEVYECEARIQHRNGEWIWVLDRGRVVEWTEDGRPLRMLGTHRDITENVRLRKELENQATTDTLTGLLNRRQFENLSHRELARAAREKETPSLLTLDIDHFKVVNDTHGHGAGDEVLKSLVRTCLPHLREVDICARLGGEEFVLLMPDTGLAGATHVAERLRKVLAASPISVSGGQEVRLTVSIGVAAWSGEPEELAGLMKRSDEALYRAKAEGRNRVCTA